MRKILILLGLFLLATPFMFARENTNTMLPTVSQWSNDGIQIINSGNDGSVVNGLTFYVVGGSTTSAATITVTASSMTVITTGGLYPGTTWFSFTQANLDTLTELAAYCISVPTTTVGAEGGIACSTSTAAIGKTASTNLTVASAVSCLGSSNVKTLTVTPAASQTATAQVCTSSMVFVTTNGLYPGTAYYTFTSSTETLQDLETALEALSSTAAGIDGTITATIPNGTYDLNVSTNLTEVAAQSILTTATLDLDTILGFSYITPIGIPRGYQRHLTGLNVNATFGTGTAYVYIYNGTAATDTLLLKYEIDTTATETPIRSIPSNGDFAGSKETQLRIDVVGSVGFTAGYMTIIGHKE